MSWERSSLKKFISHVLMVVKSEDEATIIDWKVLYPKVLETKREYGCSSRLKKATVDH